MKIHTLNKIHIQTLLTIVILSFTLILLMRSLIFLTRTVHSLVYLINDIEILSPKKTKFVSKFNTCQPFPENEFTIKEEKEQEFYRYSYEKLSAKCN